MINTIAIAMLFCNIIGSTMVLFLEPSLVISSSDGESMLKLKNEIVDNTLPKIEETLIDTEDALTKGEEIIVNPREKSMGWFRRKPKLEDQLKIVKEKFDFGKEAINEATTELKAETLKKTDLTIQSIKDKIIGDKTLQTNGATKDARDLDNGYKMESTNHKIEQIEEGVAKNEYISTPKILESIKDETFEKLKRTQDFIYDGVEHTKEKMQDAAKVATEKAFDVGVKTKDVITSNIVEFPKHKANEGVHHTQDVIIGSLQSGLEKSKSIIVDVFEKPMKEMDEFSIQDTKDTGYEISKKAKDAICKTVECLQSRAKEARSHLPNLGQGFDHVNSKSTTNIGENVEDIGEDIKPKIRDFTNSGIDSTKQSYNNIKNIGDHYFDEGRKDRVDKNYDFVTNTAQEYYDKVGQHFGKAKDYYDGSIYHDNSKNGDRRSYKGARDVPSQSHYDDAKDEDDGYFDNIKDKTKHAFDGAYYRTKNFYDNTRDKINGYVPNRPKERSGEYISMARQRIANGYHNVHDKAEDYYKNTKFKPKKDLGAMVQSMGWRRVGIVTSNHVPILDDEIILGNVKYKWDNKGEHASHQIPTSNSVLNSMEDTTYKMDERVDLTQEHITRGAQNVQDIDIQGNNPIHDASQVLQEDSLSQFPKQSWTNREYKHEEFEDGGSNDNEDDIYISSRRIRNRVPGRMRNGGHLHKFPSFRRNEYAKLVKKDLSNFVHYGEDKKNMDKSYSFCFWKDTFLRKPKGSFLLLSRALHLFTFSIVYGSSFWVTFVSGFILSKHIPRQQFGYVQSRIFPMYLRILIAGQSVLFILHSILHPWFIANSAKHWELSNFGLMIVSTIINAYVLEPQATKVMFERLKVEKEEGRGLENVASLVDAKLLMEEHKSKLASINQQFKTLHNYSSALNLISLGGLTCHLWQLAHRLVV